MYVRTREGLGQIVTAINLDHAVWMNRHYARLLGWQSAWGPAPTSRADLAPPATERNRKLIGQGSSSYGAGKAWPLHRDHMHIRLNV